MPGADIEEFPMSLIRTGSLACFLAILAACASTAPKPGVDRVLVVGATGQTGRLLVADLRAEGFQVSAFVRDAERARKTLGDDVELYVGDVKDPASIAKAMQNADALVSAIGARGAKGPDRPEMIDYQGVKNLADAAAAAQLKHFVLLSSMGVTHEDNPLNKLFGNVLIWKGKGEQAVRDSGVPYTVIRPAGLVNEAAGKGRITMVQGDPRGQKVIPRADVATVCLEALRNPDTAAGKTLEVFRVDGEAIEDWSAAFAALSSD
jgi:uncharacterized protein YbjT (DUF2867 family)